MNRRDGIMRIGAGMQYGIMTEDGSWKSQWVEVEMREVGLHVEKKRGYLG